MDNICKKAEEYVIDLFDKMHDPKLIFHNLSHTKKVVERSKEIAAHYFLNERDSMILCVAAWFHDVGHLFTSPDKHEERSVEQMKKFIAPYTNDEGLIKEIEDCILATHFPPNPHTLLQQILCDADTYHFGTKEFKETNKLVRKEHVLRIGEVSKQKWNDETLKLLDKHQYYTSYCQDLLNEEKKNKQEENKEKSFR